MYLLEIRFNLKTVFFFFLWDYFCRDSTSIYIVYICILFNHLSISSCVFSISHLIIVVVAGAAIKAIVNSNLSLGRCSAAPV